MLKKESGDFIFSRAVLSPGSSAQLLQALDDKFEVSTFSEHDEYISYRVKGLEVQDLYLPENIDTYPDNVALLLECHYCRDGLSKIQLMIDNSEAEDVWKEELIQQNALLLRDILFHFFNTGTEMAFKGGMVRLVQKVRTISPYILIQYDKPENEIKTKKIALKVDGVSSMEEVETLDSWGVDYLGVQLSTYNSEKNKPCLYLEEIEMIQDVLLYSELVVRIDTPNEVEDLAGVLSTLHSYGVAGVEFPVNWVDPDIEEVCLGYGFKVFVTGTDADIDTDPAWLVQPELAQRFQDKVHFQISVLPAYDGNWDSFSAMSSEYKDSLSPTDINGVAQQYNLWCALNITPENIQNIMKIMPDIRGVVVTLGMRETGMTPRYFNIIDDVAMIMDNMSDNTPEPGK